MKKSNLKQLGNILSITGWLIIAVNVIVSLCFKKHLTSDIDLLSNYLIIRGYTILIALILIFTKSITNKYINGD